MKAPSTTAPFSSVRSSRSSISLSERQTRSYSSPYNSEWRTLICLVLIVVHAIAKAEVIPPSVASALKKLQQADSYAWQSIIDMHGAPKAIAPMSGKTDAGIGTLIDWSIDGKSVQAVRTSNESLLKVGDMWLTAAEALRGQSADSLSEVISTLRPTDELATLLPLLATLTAAEDGSFIGTLTPDAARSFMLKMGEHRRMKPTVTNITGAFQLWLHSDGLPAKYQLTINATMSMFLMKRNITRVQTVEIKGVNSTNVDLPIGAKAKLIKTAKP